MRNMSLSEQITYSTVKICCEYPDNKTGSGTGFIMNLCVDKESNTAFPVVITNNHVVKDSLATTFDFCAASLDGEPIDTKACSVRINGNAWYSHPDKNID